jgi:hypothetical protein
MDQHGQQRAFQPEMIAMYLPEVKVLWIKSLKGTIRFMKKSLAEDDHPTNG